MVKPNTTSGKDVISDASESEMSNQSMDDFFVPFPRLYVIVGKSIRLVSSCLDKRSAVSRAPELS